MFTTKALTLSALSLSMAIMSSGMASADDIEKKCRIYANTALAQYNVAIKHNCGYGGPVWSNDFMHHYGWCLRGNNHKQVQWGTNLRIKGLKTCKGN
ncbi:hypothetical protein FDK21_19540 [Cohaesibacter sp. CAU 1516]|uniref:hypothetical protein n=1 Tax=Cohaesibacter sp. CAU 1516 TaxID=2576038 RepID=UPI0010FD7C7C|nr:hypothetical protein [Cohaesibacter sp. CAU 1516]TLP42601.1 hypothetical protein FDK21_19540 [Cohaesibacter sp. CAU 1516]